MRGGGVTVYKVKATYLYKSSLGTVNRAMKFDGSLAFITAVLRRDDL